MIDRQERDMYGHRIVPLKGTDLGVSTTFNTTGETYCTFFRADDGFRQSLFTVVVDSATICNVFEDRLKP